MILRRTRNYLCSALLLSALAACSSTSLSKMSMPKVSMPSFFNKDTEEIEPAPVEKYGELFYGDPSGEPLSVRETEEKRERRLYKTVSVQAGDTLYEVAERYNLESRDIIEFNHLRPPYHLLEGQELKLPRSLFYVVQPGDSLYAISQERGVDMSRLAGMNKLEAPYAIKPGMRLKLPFQTHTATAVAGLSDEEVRRASTADIEVEDLGDIAPAADKAPPKISKYQPRKIRYVLTKPDGTEVPVEQEESKPVEVASLRPQTRRPRFQEVKEEPSEHKEASAPKAPLPEPTGAPPGTFSWPIKGKLVNGFGPKRGGVYNDGINISAPMGTSVKAAADGVVIYAGDGLEGYGNLLIIKHKGGWITSYAHNEEITVKRGDRVKRGQTVAKVGETGHVDKPQLHFGLRKGRKAVDPTQYLSG